MRTVSGSRNLYRTMRNTLRSSSLSLTYHFTSPLVRSPPSSAIPLDSHFHRHFSSTSNFDTSPIAIEIAYNKLVDETLEELQDLAARLEAKLEDVDINLSQGVLSIVLGGEYAGKSWVINKQTPNRQIWWSSPLSGPRRYEYMHDNNATDNVNNATNANSTSIMGEYRACRWRFTRDPAEDLLGTLCKELKTVTGIDILSTPP